MHLSKGLLKPLLNSSPPIRVYRAAFRIHPLSSFGGVTLASKYLMKGSIQVLVVVMFKHWFCYSMEGVARVCWRSDL